MQPLPVQSQAVFAQPVPQPDRPTLQGAAPAVQAMTQASVPTRTQSFGDVVESAMTQAANGGDKTETVGSMLMPTGAVAHYAILDHSVFTDENNVKKKMGEWGHLLQSFALDLWRLKEPKVLISVTGGAMDFAMSRLDEDTVMQGLMDVAVETSVWFVTGGTKAGIMSKVGDARKKYAADAPLIGVAAWHMLWGKTQIEAHGTGRGKPGDKLLPPGDKLLPYGKVLKEARVKAEKEKKEEEERQKKEAVTPAKGPPLAELDSGHSHFFLIKGKNQSYGDEISSRSAFEHQVSLGRGNANLVEERLKITNYAEWEKSRNPSKREETPAQAQDGSPAPKPEPPRGDPVEVPVVLVCVQGGPGTAKTVLSAVKANTPTLIVKGSGKCADLIADVILLKKDVIPKLKKDSDPPASLSKPQKRLLEFLQAHDYPKTKALVEEFWPTKDSTGTGSTAAGSSAGKLDQILSDYFLTTAPNKRNVAEAFQDAFEATSSPLCKVFELGGDEPFGDSLLECIFSGVDNDERQEEVRVQTRLRACLRKSAQGAVGQAPALDDKESATVSVARPSTLETKLNLAVEFNNLTILKKQVSSYRYEKEFETAMNSALDTALCKRNRPEIVDFLVNNGATVDNYWLKTSTDAAYPQNEERWRKLARSVDPSVLTKELVSAIRPKDLPPREPRPESPLGKLQHAFSFTAAAATVTADGGDFRELFGKCVMKLMGSGFDYKMSLVSPELDLMLLAALRNDRDLAVVWWKEYTYPVRAALTVAMLYRNLAKTNHVIPHNKDIMRESADFFEELAAEVQNFSLEQDYFLGISNLEVPLVMWNGNTLVDIAVRSESGLFLTKCCREAIDRRFAGDLRAYDQNLGLVKGLKANVMINLCFLGLFAPWFMQFENFPLAYNLRYPTQRVPVPEEFRRGSERTYLYASDGGSEGVESMIANQMNSLSWFQRFKLFWQAPITLFLAGAMQKGFLVFAFTWWLFGTPDSTRREPFFKSYATSPEFDAGLSWNWAIWPFEVGACLLFLSSVIAEMVQCFILGLSYWFDFWNVLDATSIAVFFAGFGMRYACSNGSGVSLREWCVNPSGWDQVQSVRVDGMWVYLYSICVFLLWVRMLRLLSVSKRLGPFVILVVSMGQDIGLFAVVYAIFLAAFSVLIRGSMPLSYEHCTGGPDDPEPYKCWDTWWVVRTFIQASGGDIYMDDMKTDASVFGLMILWIVMNLLLLNLVIAIMSSTYESVKERAEKIFLFDLYEITNEFSRRSAAAPWPLNVVFILIDIVAFFLHKKKVDTIWTSQNIQSRFDLFVRRNLTVDELHEHEIHKKMLNPDDQPEAKNTKNKTPSEDEKTRVMVERDMEVEQFWEMKMAAFTARARNTFLEHQQWMDLRMKWNLRFAEKDENEQSKELMKSMDRLVAEHDKAKVVTVDRIVEVPVPVDREVPVDRIVERIVEKEVPVERIVERIVEVERIVHVQTPPAGGPLQANNSLNSSPRAPGPPATAAAAAHTGNAAVLAQAPVPIRAPQAQAQAQAHHRPPQASLGAAPPRGIMPVPAPVGQAALPVASAPAGGPSPATVPVTRSLNSSSDRDLALPPSGSQAGSSFASQVPHAHAQAGEAGWGSQAAAASGRAWTPNPNEYGSA